METMYVHCPKGNRLSEIYNTKCSGEIEILRGICRVVSGLTLHFMLYLGNLDYFLDSVQYYCSLLITVSEKIRGRTISLYL